MRRYLLLTFGLLIVISSCTMNQQNMKKDLENKLSHLKQKYVPDTRIGLWNVFIKKSEGKISVDAEVSNKDAFEAIQKLTKQYSKIETEIKLLPEKNYYQLVHALVNVSVSSIRAENRHASELVNQALLGSPVRLFKKLGDWYLCQTPNHYIGWINEQDIVLLNSKQLEEYKKAEKVIYNKQFGFAYQLPDINSQVVSDLALADILKIIGQNGHFFEIEYPDGRKAFVKKQETISSDEWLNRIPTKERVVSVAKKFMGIPYLWGGFSSKAIDCSGFTSIIYLMNGLVLQRDASQQFHYGENLGNKYDAKKMLPGDLLFFGSESGDKSKITHVAMYIGNDDFIHASGRVKINTMDSSQTHFLKEYPERLAKIRRIIGKSDSNGIEKIKDNDFYEAIF